MLSRTLIVAAAFAALAACDKPGDTRATSSAPKGDSASTAGASQTPSTPANLPAPTQAEKREGANPTQGQVDPKEKVQHRDFEQKGDSRGPTSPDTKPSN